jgi:hypothetical protein
MKLNRRVLGTLSCLFVPLAISLCGSMAAASVAQADTPPFAPDSVWNLALRPDAAISPNSAGYVQWLDNQVTTGTTWINSSGCNDPIYVAAPGTPTVPVTITSGRYQDPALLRAWSEVPIPAGAVPAACGDKNFAIQQTQPNGAIKQWEFWNATEQSDGSWVASWGGVINDIRVDRGFASPIAWTDPTDSNPASNQSNIQWNVTGTSMSMTAGVITEADIESGQINHALAVAAPNAAKGVWMWPAQRGDGTSTDPNALPEGAHLRLNPKIDLSTISMTPLVRMMAVAAQKYGIIVRDQTGSSTTTFFTQQLSSADETLFSSDLEGLTPHEALRSFPWGDLEVLNAPLCSSYDVPCNVQNKAVIDLSSSQPTVGTPVVLDTTNSTLNYPRSAVVWNFGSSADVQAGTSVTETWVPQQAGEQQVSVQITTTDGTLTTGSVEVDVLPATTDASFTITADDTLADGMAPGAASGTGAHAGAPTKTPRVLDTLLATIGNQRLNLSASVGSAPDSESAGSAASVCLATGSRVVLRVVARTLRHGAKARLRRVELLLDKRPEAVGTHAPATLGVVLRGLAPGSHQLSLKATYVETRTHAAHRAGRIQKVSQSTTVSKSRAVRFRVCA